MSETNQNWQPIYTAPKDGTCVLLFGCWLIGGKPFVWIGSWRVKEKIIEEPVSDGLYRKVTSVDGEWGSSNFLATHWMPLPAPPFVEVAGQ